MFNDIELRLPLMKREELVILQELLTAHNYAAESLTTISQTLHLIYPTHFPSPTHYRMTDRPTLWVAIDNELKRRTNQGVAA